MNSIEFRLHINITLSSVRHIVVFEHSRVVIHTLVSNSIFIYNYHYFVITPMKSIL